jgi:UDP-3-O-[3-hydroxymyristoyl] N-acetylglucosamine deacetylase
MLTSVYQHTLSETFSVTGVGVHSGAPATLTVHAAPVNNGITFIRTDITDRDNVIAARFDSVTDTRLCTVLANKAGATVSTVEHVLSAFAALGVDNAVVEIDGPEIPIMDGSAAPFVKALDRAGLARQKTPRKVIVIKKTISVQDGDKEVILSPADGQYFGFEIAFDNALIGRQKYLHKMKESSYRAEISSARTFGFLHEVEALRKMGLARGGSLDNAIVVDGDKVLNPDGLRYKNEFVRHKVLDAIGDIYLAGFQIIGHYHGVKAGHAMNNKILHALFADPTAYALVSLNQQEAQTPARASMPAFADTAMPVTA